MLEMCDIYGLPYNFTLFDKPVFKTNVGGAMSLLTIVFFVLSMWYFGQDFFKRRNPHYINQKSIEKSYPKYQISNQNLVIAIAIHDSNSDPVDYSNYFRIETIYNNVTSTKNNQIYRTSIGVRDCKLIDFTAMRLSTDRVINEKTTCLDLDNMLLGGYNDQDWYYNIEINVLPCFNLTNKTNCASFDKVKDYIHENGVYLSILSNSYYTELTDYENPLKLHLFEVSGTIDTNIGKYNEIYYKEASIKSDMGILTDQSKNYSVFGIDIVYNDFNTLYPPLNNPSNQTIFVANTIFFLNSVETYVVNYIKIQEIFANIGGILNVISLFFSIIASVFNVHLRDIKVINHLFDFVNFDDDNALDKIINDDDNQIELNQIIEKIITPQDPFLNNNISNRSCIDSRYSFINI